jgi:farnesyl-diphosphate farnesyltransferase
MDTIFPPQTAEAAKRNVVGELSEAEKRKAELEAETRQDMYFMLALMGVIVLIVSIIMVSPFSVL